MNTFREHDRAVAMSPERQQLSDALSRLTQVNSELQLVRVQLQEERASASAFRAGVASNYARQQHLDRLAEGQKTFDRLRHEEETAKAVVAHFRATIQTRRLAGRSEVHRQITANIVGAVMKLRDAVAVDQQFREQLAKDMLRFGAPLESMGPRSWEGGGPGWIDGLLPVLKPWIAQMTKRDAYGFSKNPAPAKPKRAVPQPV